VRKGQSLIEFIILIGIAVTALFMMGPAVKRGYQAIIRGTADQLSTQRNAEQEFAADESHLESTNTLASSSTNRSSRDLIYTTTTVTNEDSTSQVNTITSMGFTPQ
jgi:hypothetical protein